MRTYSHFVRHDSDFSVAQEKGLIRKASLRMINKALSRGPTLRGWFHLLTLVKLKIVRFTGIWDNKKFNNSSQSLGANGLGFGNERSFFRYSPDLTSSTRSGLPEECARTVVDARNSCYYDFGVVES